MVAPIWISCALWICYMSPIETRAERAVVSAADSPMQALKEHDLGSAGYSRQHRRRLAEFGGCAKESRITSMRPSILTS